MMQLLKEAFSAGHSADYVLFNCWFANLAQITVVKSMDMDVIAMIKKISRIQYLYDGKKTNIKQIYAKNVCVRNKVNRKDWLDFVCTNSELSEEEIMRIYGKRWQVEAKRKFHFRYGKS